MILAARSLSHASGLSRDATVLEVSGDAVIRLAIYQHGGSARIGLMLAGAALLFGYGVSLNLAPVEFGQVVGLYIATLFIVWQVVNLAAFRTLPTLLRLADRSSWRVAYS